MNIAIIGCGHWGKNYIRIFSDTPKAKLSICCDSNANALKSISTKYPEISTTTNYNEILSNKDISIVIVSTPASSHYEIIKTALESGKDVLAEKPLTIKLEESEKLVEIAKSKNRILMVGHTFLFNPAIRKIKEYIQNGTVGSIYYMHSTRTHLGLVREDVNAIWDLATHDVSIFNYFLDKMPVSVSAVGGCYLKKGREDTAFITLTYPENVIANIQVSWVDSNKVREIQVIGSKTRIVFDDLNNLERIKIYEKGITVGDKPYNDFGEFQYILRDGDIISPKIDLYEPLKAQCDHFLDCVEKRETPLTDGKNGLDIVRVMCAIEKSVKNNGMPVSV
jgi:predicted dehydrogenase